MFGRFSKAYIAKGSVLPKGEAACLAWSGGLSSSLLLHYLDAFLNRIMKQNVTPRFSSLVVCVVDYSCLLSPEKKIQVEAEVVEMRALVESKHFEFHRIRLESAFENMEGNLDRVLVADLECMNASTIASQIVTQTALGGGFNLPNEISLEYKPPGTDLVIFRPIRDLLFAEVEKVIELEHVRHFPVVSGMSEGLFGGVVAGKVGKEGASVAKMTIQDLATSFVRGLQQDFPQSVSTVTRTAFKIQTGSDAPGLRACLLCAKYGILVAPPI
ncbi:hypothetical protein HDU98_000267 [Podochytrium sp. JEL0797]|nr:hypothetical protein HDU98_000267 [Podochytrium sp. JEL0797]